MFYKLYVQGTLNWLDSHPVFCLETPGGVTTDFQKSGCQRDSEISGGGGLNLMALHRYKLCPHGYLANDS